MTEAQLSPFQRGNARLRRASRLILPAEIAAIFPQPLTCRVDTREEVTASSSTFDEFEKQAQPPGIIRL